MRAPRITSTRRAILLGKRSASCRHGTIDEYRALLIANRLDRARITEVEVDWNARPCSIAGRCPDRLREIMPAELIADRPARSRPCDSPTSRPALQPQPDRERCLVGRARPQGHRAQDRRGPGRRVMASCATSRARRPPSSSASFRKCTALCRPEHDHVGRQLGTLQIGCRAVGWEDTLKILRPWPAGAPGRPRGSGHPRFLGGTAGNAFFKYEGKRETVGSSICCPAL